MSVLVHSRLTLLSIALGASLLAAMPASGQDQAAPASASSAAPDNSARNRNHRTTADQQKDNVSDRSITQNIRKAIIADKSLSTYAHNVKIVTVHGAVTLKGPVRSDDEKKKVEDLATQVLNGTGNLTNQMTVKS